MCHAWVLLWRSHVPKAIERPSETFEQVGFVTAAAVICWALILGEVRRLPLRRRRRLYDITIYVMFHNSISYDNIISSSNIISTQLCHVYTYMCVYIYIYIYVRVYIYIYIYIRIYLSLYVYVCVYIYIYTHKCLSLDIYIYIYIHIHTYISLSLYIYIYIYIYVYVHTYVPPRRSAPPASSMAAPWPRAGRQSLTASLWRVLVRWLSILPGVGRCVGWAGCVLSNYKYTLSDKF